MTKLLLLFDGISDVEVANKITLGDGTNNFFPDGKGYLVNYPGKKDMFQRDLGEQPGTSYKGTPPASDDEYTVLESFIDFLGTEHLVFVKGNKLYEKQGNGYRELADIDGKNIDGLYAPYIFVHEKKLVIVNEGGVPLIWDGVEGVEPLGVHEVPSPPDLYLVANHNFWNLTGANKPHEMGTVWYHFNEGQIQTGPTLRKDGSSNDIDGYYQTCVQFVDRYGNHGKASPPSIVMSVSPVGSSSVGGLDRDDLVCEWIPPVTDRHIHYVRQGRTLTLNPSDAEPLGVSTTMYTETYLEGTTQHRRTQRLTDSGLAGREQIDFEVGPPPSAVMGASFQNRIWLVDANGDGWYSDLLLFGQFRDSQRINFHSKPVAIVPANDRIFVIGTKSTEVFYESQNGPTLLESDVESGSQYGNTFVMVGDGVIFGLWNNGFGFYDGKEHIYVDMPEYIGRMFVDVEVDTSPARKIGDYYYLPARFAHKSSNNTNILMFNIKTRFWYLIEETVRDVVQFDNEIIGCQDSLYILFKGEDYSNAVISTNGVTMSLNTKLAVKEMRVLMEASSTGIMEFEIISDESEVNSNGNVMLHPSEDKGFRNTNLKPNWSKPNEEYPAIWQAPGDYWFGGVFGRQIPGYYHRIYMSFPDGAPIRIKAVELTYAGSGRAERQ